MSIFGLVLFGVKGIAHEIGEKIQNYGIGVREKCSITAKRPDSGFFPEAFCAP
jgi:hypothetical protein